MNKAIQEDVENAKLPIGILDALYGKTIFITGATGLIGSQLIWFLAYQNQRVEGEKQISILAHVRNQEKAEYLFSEICEADWFQLVIGDICAPIEYVGEIDYIVHGASNTDSKKMIEQPVETSKTTIVGTENVLSLAVEKNIRGMVYLSSMEAYGFTIEQKVLNEDAQEYLNPLSVRSCYPMSKRMAESMCVSYASEYEVPVKIVRLAQTFGAGVSKDDMRVFAEFARCVLEHRDIHLSTDGKSSRMYLYTMDAVTAILTVLIKGEKGNAYNAANSESFCSIGEMAQMVIDKFAVEPIRLVIDMNEKTQKKFPPAHYLYLNTLKIEELGWRAQIGLCDMYVKMIDEWREQCM